MFDILYLPWSIFLFCPYAAFVPALIFLSWYFKFARKALKHTLWKNAVLITGVLWVLYGIYEIRMYFWSKTVVAPIRVDLLFICPVMAMMSFIGIVACFKAKACE